MKKLLKYFREYTCQVILGPFFKLLEASFELIVPLIVSIIIDQGINGNKDMKFIMKYVGILLILGVVGLICSITAQYFSAAAATGFSCKLRKALFSKLQSLSYKEIDDLGNNKMISLISNDVNQVQTGVNLFLRLLLRSPFVVIGALIMAFIVDKKVAIVFTIVIPILFIVIFLIMKITKPTYNSIQENIDGIVKSTNENLSGVRVIRSFNNQESEIKEYHQKISTVNKLQKKAGYISGLSNPLTYAIINIGIIAILYLSAKRVDSGILVQGNVIALYNYMSQILIELVKLANLIITVSKSLACANRIEKALEMESSLMHREDDQEHYDKSFIEFDNVSFKYNRKGNNSLTNVSFKINKGETIGIIGGTGSGKTTIINLLSHFYDASEGNIYFNGKNVNSIDKRILQDRISIVPQKAVLFKGTIRSNMCYRKENSSDEEIMEALKIAQIDSIVQTKEAGLDSKVSASGKNFSGGQRQRLTIARALINNPDVLILDDSCSALDYLTDYNLRTALKNIENGMTTIMISQRTSSIAHADKILVLQDGILVGCGTHQELLETCSIYQEIYNSQFKEGAK